MISKGLVRSQIQVAYSFDEALVFQDEGRKRIFPQTSEAMIQRRQ